MTFGQKLMNLRKGQGMSQEQLGERIGVSRQAVSKWENDETSPEMEKLIQLSDLFGISLDEMVGRTPPQALATATEYAAPYMHNPLHYEYKSKRTLWGLPLVHINAGYGGFYQAKGIVAIGHRAKGVVAIGGVSLGIISFGGLSTGIVSVGGLSLGLLLSLGGISVGAIAIGGLAVGIFAVGGAAIGTYAMGGGALGSKIASGGFANAPIAIGDQTVGQYVFDTKGAIAPDAVKRAIFELFPKTPKWIANLFAGFGGAMR